MATTSFDTTFRINPDWGVKNLENGLEEYEKNGPRLPSPSVAPVLKPTAEVMKKIEKLKEDCSYIKIEKNI